MAPEATAQDVPRVPRHHLPTTRILLVVLVAAIVIGATLFVASLPPPLAIKDGSISGAIRANFPSVISTTSPAFGNFTATTYANQSTGPSSSLTMTIHSYGFAAGYYGVIDHVEFFYDVAVVGRFAPNVHLSSLALTCNVTGSHIAILFFNKWDQGANVSADRQQTFGFFDNGTGVLTASLMNSAGPGPFYEFEYGANGQTQMRYQYTQFLGFRATVTGWMLPPISVGILIELKNVPKTVILFPAGTNWSFADGGHNDTQFEVPTSAPFVMTGAFDASTPVTAYILNLTELWGLLTDGTPTSYHWTSGAAKTSAGFNVTLPPGYLWYLVFQATPAGVGGGQMVSVLATQDFAATM